MKSSPFHAGERAVQQRAGVSSMAKRVANGIHDYVPPVMQEFLEDQPMVFLGMTDAQGRVWASALTGEPGFVMALSEESLHLDAFPTAEDPLYEALARPDLQADMGLLAIDLATRKRMRVNGTVTASPNGGLLLQTRQVYANCPKFIQTRSLEWQSAPTHPEESSTTHGDQLTEEQQARIGRADTFFIASVHREGGADVSHRGGNPGFIVVQDSATLAFPDYPGNTMFNTLGNLTADPRAGLLFVDFETGATLQLTGTAEVIWEAERIAALPGAERIVVFHIAEAVERPHAFPLHGSLTSYSPFNPRQKESGEAL